MFVCIAVVYCFMIMIIIIILIFFFFDATLRFSPKLFWIATKLVLRKANHWL